MLAIVRLLVLVAGGLYGGLHVTSSSSIWRFEGLFGERYVFEGANRVWRALTTSILSTASLPFFCLFFFSAWGNGVLELQVIDQRMLRWTFSIRLLHTNLSTFPRYFEYIWNHSNIMREIYLKCSCHTEVWTKLLKNDMILTQCNWYG